MSWFDEHNSKAQAQGRQIHDNHDAAIVEALRALGKKLNRQRTYDKRAAKFLKGRGY